MRSERPGDFVLFRGSLLSQKESNHQITSTRSLPLPVLISSLRFFFTHGVATSTMGAQPMPDTKRRFKTSCCIAGGGPAGMMLGFLLARAGVEVLVLEKHADFLRDFRGDTIHPSTLEIMYELGILDEFLQRPHQELAQIGGQIEDSGVTIADFSHLPTHCK